MFQKENSNDSEEIITLSEEEDDSIETNIKKEKDENQVICIKLKKYKPDEKFIDTEIPCNIDNTDNTNNIDNNKNGNALLNRKRKRENNKKININLEFKLFYKLVEKYGIEKVVSSLCKSDNIYSNTAIDQMIDKISDTCDKNKFIGNIIKTYFYLLKEYMQNNNEIKNALTNKKNYDQQRILSKSKINNNNKLNINFQINDNNMIEIPERGVEGGGMTKNLMKLECHYNRDEEGNIYKYKIMYLLGNLAVFKCFDDKCNGDAIFDLDQRKFKVEQKHNKKYYEHNFVINGKIDNDIIYNQMNNNKSMEAQILLKDNSEIVRFYA